jgi:hypothetical protein
VKIYASLLILALGVPPAFAFGDKQPELLARLRQARIESSIDGADMKPWHLKFAFELFDEKGAQTDSGTVEEWRTPGKYRIVVASKGYSSTQVRNEHGYFRTADTDLLPEPIYRMIAGVIHPLGPGLFSDDNLTIKLRKDTIGGSTMDCIVVGTNPNMAWKAPLGSFPTYCLEEGTTTLRLKTSPFETLTLAHVGRFSAHSIGAELILYTHSQLEGKVHVTALGGVPESDGNFENTAGLVKRDAIPLEPSMKYPELVPDLRPEHRQALAHGGMDHGLADVELVVGKDGHVTSVRLLKTDNQAYGDSLVQQMTNWQYKPYLIDGAAVSIELRSRVPFSTSWSVRFSR